MRLKHTALLLAASLMGLAAPLRAEFLYEHGFLESDTTAWYYWNDFRYAHTTPNQANSSGGPVLPLSSPSITQHETSAFVIGGGTGNPGRIYSFAAPTRFEVNNTTSYQIGMVALQFRTMGSLTDFSSIKLVYTDEFSVTHELAADQYLKEYRSSFTPGMGFSAENQSIFQWNLTGLNITSYKITLNAANSSMSFRQALMDVGTSYNSITPEVRTWQTAGSGLWSQASNWQEGSSSIQNGNVRFNHSGGAANVTLDQTRKVGEFIIDSAEDITITSASNQVIELYTGIHSESRAVGHTQINSNISLQAYNLFNIEAGTVELAGTVSGNYGIFKQGEGTLILSANNTFNQSLGVHGGTVRIEGSNLYANATSIVSGELQVAHNSPVGVAGALGISTAAVFLGANSTVYQHQLGDLSATLLIDGNYTIGQGIELAGGNFRKTLSARNANSAATFSGTVAFTSASLGGTADNVHFTTHASTDRLIFSGQLTGGNSSNLLTISGPGTVIYSGTNKTYQTATRISSGTLLLEEGVQFNGNGNVTVGTNGKFVVNGELRGTGALTIEAGGLLGGSGEVLRDISFASGSKITPGNSIGLLTTQSQTWGEGVTLELELGGSTPGLGIGWDGIEITGGLELEGSLGSPYQLTLSSLSSTIVHEGGIFDPTQDARWTFLTTTEGITGFDASLFNINAGALGYSHLGAFAVTSLEGNLILTYTGVQPIPEPQSWLLIGLGAGVGGLLYKRRRRQNAAASA